MHFFSSQTALPVQAEVDIKISGFQCNLIVSRIKPLIRINSDKKKPLVLHDNPQQKKAPKEKLALSLACTLSAPELTLVLHSLDDVPLYHVSIKYLMAAVLYFSVLSWFCCLHCIIHKAQIKKIHSYIRF
jgi:hypothetical protein